MSLWHLSSVQDNKTMARAARVIVYALWLPSLCAMVIIICIHVLGLELSRKLLQNINRCSLKDGEPGFKSRL